MKQICIGLVLATLFLTAGRKYPDGWQFIPLPVEDEYATNRFGRSWLEPVYNGYLIVNNRYIEAPYVVEQRGFVIFVNNERIEDGTDIRLVSPIPSPPPITVDPGTITGLSKTSSLSDLFRNPTYRAKQEYWNNMELYGETRFRTTIKLLQTLPCVSNVVDLKSKAFDGSEIQIWDYQGNSLLVSLQTAPRKPMQTATDSEIYSHIVGALGGRSRDLRDEMVFYIRNGSNPGGSGAVWETNRWIEVFHILVSNMTVSQKVEMISTTKAMGSSVSDHTIRTMLPMDGFAPTPQLWQRLSGDMSWTNDAPARLLALTNGWQRILPAFMRTQTVAVATVAVGVKTNSATEIAAVKSLLPQERPMSSAASANGASPIVPRASSGRVWFVVALGGVLVVLVLLTRHLSRKWDHGYR